MLRDLHRPVWISDHPDAFTDIIFDDHRFNACLEKETFKMKKQYIVLISSVSLAVENFRSCSGISLGMGAFKGYKWHTARLSST